MRSGQKMRGFEGLSVRFSSEIVLPQNILFV